MAYGLWRYAMEHRCRCICADVPFVVYQVRFNSPNSKQSGWLREWTLMLHGTRDDPYNDLPAGDQHSKLAIVKKAHEERLKVRK